MFKRYIKILSNPLLYYSDKEGNSVFRNFSLLKQTGFVYHKKFEKHDVGAALEHRFELDKKLRLGYFIATIIIYLIFIHVKFSIWSLLFFEAVWIAVLSGIRLWCSRQYIDFLLKMFGAYEVTEFEPPVSKKKSQEFVALFRSKIILIIIAVLLFFVPSFLLQFIMKHSLTPKHNGYKRVITLSNIHNAIYPKNSNIYDMRAVSHYMRRDYDSALADYRISLDLSGRRFTKRDFVRFENLLLAQKKVTTPQDAIDVFNEYITKKKMTVMQKSQMLWVKSIFKIENSIIDSILQDYDDLSASLNSKDERNQFYVSCDRTYMLVLMQQYQKAIESYDELIKYAEDNSELFSNDIQSLYAERGWTKKHLGDDTGAEADFKASGISQDKLKEHEPTYVNQAFVRENF